VADARHHRIVDGGVAKRARDAKARDGIARVHGGLDSHDCVHPEDIRPERLVSKRIEAEDVLAVVRFVLAAMFSSCRLPRTITFLSNPLPFALAR
jgi:hypothetical protein